MYELSISNETSNKTIYMPDSRHGLLETSASLNKNFRANHSDFVDIKCTTIDEILRQINLKMRTRLIFKIDVESHKPEVLKGTQECISKFRPLIFLEILPDSDINFFYKWAYLNNYNHCTLSPPNKAIESRTIQGALSLRDHLFFPEETSLKCWLTQPQDNHYFNKQYNCDQYSVECHMILADYLQPFFDRCSKSAFLGMEHFINRKTLNSLQRKRILLYIG